MIDSTIFKATFQYIFDELPKSPMKSIDVEVIKPFLSKLNWFVPVGQMLDIFLGFLGAYVVWLGISHLLRNIKLIG